MNIAQKIILCIGLIVFVVWAVWGFNYVSVARIQSIGGATVNNFAPRLSAVVVVFTGIVGSTGVLLLIAKRPARRRKQDGED